MKWHGQETKEMVEIPYTPIRTPFGELTGFQPSFPWSKFSWIDTDTNEMCTKQETQDIPDRFYLFIDGNYMKLSENLEYTQNLALPTGGPEITEILKEQLDYWNGNKLLDHRHMNTHIHTKFQENYQI